MREFGQIHSRFWQNPAMLQVSEKARLLAVYLLTCHHSSMTGIYRMPLGYVAADFGWDEEIVRETVSELFQNSFVDVYEDLHLIVIRRFMKYNRAKNSNVIMARVKELMSLPAGQLRLEEPIRYLRENARDIRASEQVMNSIETVAKQFQNSSETVTDFVGGEKRVERREKRVESISKSHCRVGTRPELELSAGFCS